MAIELEKVLGHEVIRHRSALSVGGKGRLQISSFGCAPESAHVPLDLTGIEAQLFRHHKGLRMPLLYIGREVDEDLAIVLDDLKPFESTEEGPDSGRVESETLLLWPWLTRFLDDIQCNH